MEIYCLTDLETRHQKFRCPQGQFFLRAIGEDLLCACPLASGGLRGFLAYG